VQGVSDLTAPLHDYAVDGVMLELLMRSARVVMAARAAIPGAVEQVRPQRTGAHHTDMDLAADAGGGDRAVGWDGQLLEVVGGGGPDGEEPRLKEGDGGLAHVEEFESKGKDGGLAHVQGTRLGHAG